MTGKVATEIRRLSRRQAVQAAAWAALNGVLAVVFILLLLVDEAAAHAAGF